MLRIGQTCCTDLPQPLRSDVLRSNDFILNASLNQCTVKIRHSLWIFNTEISSEQGEFLCSWECEGKKDWQEDFIALVIGCKKKTRRGNGRKITRLWRATTPRTWKRGRGIKTTQRETGKEAFRERGRRARVCRKAPPGRGTTSARRGKLKCIFCSARSCSNESSQWYLEANMSCFEYFRKGFVLKKSGEILYVVIIRQ